MSWDTTPWFVGGGAVHSPEVTRTLAYAALGGKEGIISPADLKVRALAVPGTSVRVLTGACSIISRASGGSSQAYVARNPTEDVVPIAATGSGAGRSDLIVARIEDPFMAGEPWAKPAEAASAQYVYTRVLSNVGAGATKMPAGQTGIPLARIDIPANTATITDAMIVDLRKVARPQKERTLQTYTMSTGYPWDVPPAQVNWEPETDWRPTTEIPPWATRAQVVLTASNLAAEGGNSFGRMRLSATDGLTTIKTSSGIWDTNNVYSQGDHQNFDVMCAATIDVSAFAGKTITWTVEAMSLNSGLTANTISREGSSFILDVEVVESAR